MKLKGVLLFGLILLALIAQITFADLRVDPPNRSALIGAWAGYENGAYCFYRIVLETNGTGSCVVVFDKEPPDTYKIHTWGITNGNMVLSNSPQSERSERIDIRIQYVDPLKMDLLVTGAATNEWRRKATLYKERQFLDKVNAAVKALPR